jgi:hypothetical protein
LPGSTCGNRTETERQTVMAAFQTATAAVVPSLAFGLPAQYWRPTHQGKTLSKPGPIYLLFALPF